MSEDGKTVVYFIPHQDDELLTFGVDICKTVKKYRVVVVLCTDGSNSYVRSVLSNQHRCNKHLGKHIYNLTKEEFVLARDEEFINSCIVLGINREDIVFPSHRAEDGKLSVEIAEQIVDNFFSKNGLDVIMACSMKPLDHGIQHSDHTNLGIALERRLPNGVKLKQFVEPYCLSDEIITCKNKIVTVKASWTEKKSIRNAIKQYCVWKPNRGRYAVGFHSVTDEFEKIKRNPRGHYFEVFIGK